MAISEQAYLMLLERVELLEQKVAGYEVRLANQSAGWIEGKLDGALAKGGSATLDIYEGPSSSWADTSETATVVWPSGVGWAVGSGQYLAAIDFHGEWRPFSADCP